MLECKIAQYHHENLSEPRKRCNFVTHTINRGSQDKMKQSARALLWMMTLLFAQQMMGDNPVKRNTAFEQYIEQYKSIAIEEMHKYGIPASITLAQGLLESGAGSSELSLRGNNHFGIKCHGWQGRTIYHDDDFSGECFRAYDNPIQSFEDHSLFLAKRDRYRRLFLLPLTDYRGWARGLKACGYATNPRYAQKLIDIIENYELNVYDQLETPKVSASSSLERASAPKVVLTAHRVMKYNDNYYVYAKSGDTFASLAREMGLTASVLAEHNERNKNDELREGDIIYMEKKAKRADRKFKNRPHVVIQGQSLYVIAQLYGIQMKSLVKMNKWLKDRGFQVKVGDKVRVY